MCGALTAANWKFPCRLRMAARGLSATSESERDPFLPSAKVWFDPTTDWRRVAAADGHVTATTWYRNHRQPQLVREALPCLSAQQIEFSLSKGATVSLPAFLDIKGAFVTADGTEHVAVSKRTRAIQIHFMGWTWARVCRWSSRCLALTASAIAAGHSGPRDTLDACAARSRPRRGGRDHATKGGVCNFPMAGQSKRRWQLLGMTRFTNRP